MHKFSQVLVQIGLVKNVGICRTLLKNMK
jgi:hypothetical protein